jgi:hypothetical protein
MGLLLFIHRLEEEFPAMRQPWWYVDDAGAGGKFHNLERLFWRLQETLNLPKESL